MIRYLNAILNLNSPTIQNPTKMASILDSLLVVRFWNGQNHIYGTDHSNTEPFYIWMSTRSVLKIWMLGIWATLYYWHTAEIRWTNYLYSNGVKLSICWMVISSNVIICCYSLNTLLGRSCLELWTSIHVIAWSHYWSHQFVQIKSLVISYFH